MGTLIDKLKELTGRKLSEEEMSLVKSNGDMRTLYDNDQSELRFWRIGNQVIKRKARCPSKRGSNSHSIYTSEGLLISKSRYRYDTTSPKSIKERIYSPAGSFFGKRNDRYIDVDSMEDVDGKIIVTESRPERGGKYGNSGRRFREAIFSSESSKLMGVYRF